MLKNSLLQFTSYLKTRQIRKVFHSKVKGEKDLTANFDPELYKQTMMNIIQNAFDEVDANGKVQINYKSVNDKLVITVSDNGDGIPSEDQKKIFDLYYTTKKEGNGLGLSISQKIISQHNGMIDIISDSKGTIFKITIPIS